MSLKVAYAGMDIGGTNIKYGLVDPKGKVLFREQRPTMVEKGAEPLMHLVTNIAERLLYYAAEEDFEVKSLGVGTGVGGGIVIDGKIWRGANFTAGEVGHITIDHDGPKCRCGSRGCLE